MSSKSTAIDTSVMPPKPYLPDGMIDAYRFAQIVIAHAKRNEHHAVYALINARDYIWRQEAATGATR